MRLSRFLLAMLILAGFASAGQTQPQKPEPISEATRTTVRASNDFACELFRALAQEKPDANAFVSPWSISSALAMTLEGARNDCAAEMGQVLGLPKDLRQAGERPWRLEPYHQGFAELQRRCTPPRDEAKAAAMRDQIKRMRAELKDVNLHLARRYTAEFAKKAEHLVENINKLEAQVDQYQLNIANAIWGERTFPFDASYVENVSRHYGTGLLRNADFINKFPDERAAINAWVEEQTKNKIRELIPDMPPEVARQIRMILVNAIYFKGLWNAPFKKEWTKDEPFFLADGTKDTTPLMRQPLAARYAAFNADGSYFETPLFTANEKNEKTYPADGFVVAELPYKGNRLAMTILVPRNANGLAALEKKLDGANLAIWLARLQPREVQVWLPKFKMDTSYELWPTLVKLGMNKAFDANEADFTGMSKSGGKLLISRVIHKAFVDVNEEGTEAAAATAVIVAEPNSEPAHPFVPDVRADRPFVFLIREVDTGAILFMGRMTTPTK